ncbi:MAG: ABC transporter ATP-binding protein [Geminicoccaceae bacterium]
MSDTVISLRNLKTSFRVDGVWRPAVNDVSFDVARNETVSVVGESGSGKSVTALSIMQLIPMANGRIEGEIRFKDRNLLELGETEMRKVRGNDISMIFQEPMTSLNPVLTVGFQVAEALRYHRGMDRAEADRAALEILDQVRIPSARSRFHDYPHLFSGGMRQRVMIAMALACRPDLLIADEPTTALDVTIQAQIIELIKTLQREIGMSVLFITHDMGVVAEISDRVIVMYHGEKVEEGPSEQIFSNPQHRYTRTLLAAVPRLGSMQGFSRPVKFADMETPEPVEEPEPEGLRSAGPPLLEVADLVTRFDITGGVLSRPVGRVHAVEGVSFTLHAGETLALVGESGCGKSTTGRSVLRLIEPRSGVIRFEGEDLLGVDREALKRKRRHMQMIFQDPFASLNPRKTVGSAIAEPMLVHGVCDREEAEIRVTRLLEQVGLDASHALRFPHEFSGGQRQRICIARALGLSPRLIVADESVSALDVSIKAQVINLMLDLQRELGLAYLFISHDIAVVERVSHRVAVMYLGEIVEIGPREAIFERPAHPYTKKLMSAVPVPDPARRGIRREISNDEVPSPVRTLDYQPPARPMIEVGPGHFIQQFE